MTALTSFLLKAIGVSFVVGAALVVAYVLVSLLILALYHWVLRGWRKW
jgi:hypothetical protein